MHGEYRISFAGVCFRNGRRPWVKQSEEGKRLETLVAWLTEFSEQYVCNVENESSLKPGSKQRIISCRSLDVGLKRLEIYKRTSSASNLSKRTGIEDGLMASRSSGFKKSMEFKCRCAAKRNRSAEDLICDYHPGLDSSEGHRDVLLEKVDGDGD